MDREDLLAFAESQLNRTLSFFERADAKASVLFAVNTALLAVVCLNLRLPDLAVWYLAIPAALAVALSAVSMLYIYRCMFPNLDGGSGSLIYFREIAKLTESNYITKFTNADCEVFSRDILGQVWRNSEILKIKFDSVRMSFLVTASALVPWLIFLTAASVTHGSIPALG